MTRLSRYLPQVASLGLAIQMLTGAAASAQELRAPWQGSARISQGNHGPVSHNICGHRTLQPDNCAWENTYALDIALPYGTDVLAAAGGDVTYASDDISPSGGRQMAVTSFGPDGTQTTLVFMHLSAILVHSGHVSQGDTIARSGASSDGSENGTSPHLHIHAWAGFGSHDSHTTPISNLIMKRTGVDATFRRYDENNGDLDDWAVTGGTFESNNGAGAGSSTGGSTGEFTIGSRVAAATNAPDGSPYLVIGDQGTITCVFTPGGYYDVMVDWDRETGSGSGFGSCAATTRMGHAWAVKYGWIKATGSSVSTGSASAPRVDNVSPSSILLNAPTWLTINGANFQSGFTAAAQGYAIASAGLRFVNANQVMVEVSMGGTTSYTANIVIKNPDGQSASGNFMVTAAPTGGSTGGFTIGSRVAAATNAPDGSAYLVLGDQGTITCVFAPGGYYDVMVDWDRDTGSGSGFGNCAGTTRMGHAWAVKYGWITAAGASASTKSTLAPSVDNVNPGSIPLNTPTWLTVNGTNFQNGFAATVQGYAIASAGLRFVNTSQVMVQVTMGGTTAYTANIAIRNPDGQSAGGTFQVR